LKQSKKNFWEKSSHTLFIKIVKVSHKKIKEIGNHESQPMSAFKWNITFKKKFIEKVEIFE
jgi:hypothetical protein